MHFRPGQQATDDPINGKKVQYPGWDLERYFRSSGGTSYAVQFPTPLAVSGSFSFEVVQSPENSLRDSGSLLGMVARAGSGEAVVDG